MNMSEYVRLCKGVNDRGKLVSPDSLHDHITDDKDYYVSVFKYNDKHLNIFKKSGTIKGIKDVITNKLVFDFDSKSNVELAKKDALEVCTRLLNNKIKKEDIEIYFSGNKGFNVIVTLNRNITPEIARSLAINKFGKGLDTLDLSLYDAAQILRVPGTKHQVSGLYKTPLTYDELKFQPISKIKELAKNIDNIPEDKFHWSPVDLPEPFFEIPKEEKVIKEVSSDIKDALKTKPKQWKDYKWALLQGFFGDTEGERHHVMMILASTCRALGYDKETTYYMCKSALKKQAQRTGRDEFPKEELWNNIIETSIFGDSWEGGQYSPKNDPWLKSYCEKMGFKVDQEDQRSILDIEFMGSKFQSFAQGFEDNIIKTGIAELDANVTFCTSTLAGLLGQPGAGKTSMAINYLLNTSKNGVDSVFASLDMGMPLVFAKLVQKETGYDFKRAVELFKNNPTEALRIKEKLKTDYKKVGFNFQTGQTVADIKRTIDDRQQETGNKVKLVVVDYLERINGEFSDPTANTGRIANQLLDLATEMEVLVLLLLQTQKHSTPDISDPLTSMKGVKGASIIEQNCSTILTLWREGYNPATVDDDRYISFAVVKNRFGPLWQGDFSWNGITGNIHGLSEEEAVELKEFRNRKEQERLKRLDNNDSPWG